MDGELTTQAASQLVPASYAEKAMASLMQLHSELMDEKERRVDLFRRLMEKEQALAELKMYVKVLEEKLAPAQPIAVSAPSMPAPMPAQTSEAPKRPTLRVAPVPPVPPQVAPGRARPEGWRSW